MNVNTTLKSIARRLPIVGGLVAERDALLKSFGIAPPGHFYSPIASLAEVTKDEAIIFGPLPRTIAGIELREAEQMALLDTFADFYATQPFYAQKTEGLRYWFENPAYSYSDAIMLHCMIRHLRPRRIIEIGSGHSSCVTLDTNERFFGDSIATTFIEPYPELLLSLVTPRDRERIKLIPMRLQDVPLSEFEALESGDILFVDSTHVSKVGSDVNRLFFDVLPALRAGVHVHIHDVFYPFEYPKEWIYGGRSWSELYLLRAFLQYNEAFRIVLMNTFLEHFHEAFFRERMPLCLENLGGSIWLRKQV
jgi:hypothetical protein